MNILYTTKKETRFSWTLLRTMAVMLVLMFSLSSCDDDEEEQKPPVISAVDPASAPEGTPITISGTNFATGATVKFGTQTATVTDVTATQIITAVPTGLSIGSTTITVTVGDNTSSPFSFEVLAEPIPLIASIAPSSALRGTQVTIAGTNFTPTATVKFGTQTATVTSATTAQIVVTVPASLAVGNTTVTVTVEDRVSNAFAFEVLADPPAIASFTPLQGVIGTSVTLTGQNFSDTDAENVVKFGTVTAVVTSATPTQIVTAVPAGLAAGAVSLSVAVNGQSVTASQQFTVTVPEIPVKSLYWAQLDATNTYDVIKGYKNASGTLVVEKLYDAQQDALITGIAISKGTKDIYWTEQLADFSGSIIYKGDTLGSAPTPVFESLDFTTYVDKLAIGNNKLYWSQQGVDVNSNTINSVMSASLDGSNPMQLYTTGIFETLTTLTIDPVSGSVYFIEDQSDPSGVGSARSVVYKGNSDGLTYTSIFSEADLPGGALTNTKFVGLVSNGTLLFVAKQDRVSTEISEILTGSVNGGTLTSLYQSIPANPNTNPLEAIAGITLDVSTSYLYWINRGGTEEGGVYSDGSIYRGSTTGGNAAVLFNNIKTQNDVNSINSGRTKKKKRSGAGIGL